MPRNRINDPRFPLYWENFGFSSEESASKAKLECRKRSVRCYEYWMLKYNMTLNEAMEKVKEIQDHGKSHIGMKRGEEQRENMRKAQNYINSLEYWIEKYGELDGKLKYSEYCENRKNNAKLGSKKRLELNPNSFIESSVRRVEYWIRQGYSEEDAKFMVSKQQSRGIDFYIKHYGRDEGLKKWRIKNEKWFNSFYNSGKNLEEINEKRKLNCHVGLYTEGTIKGISELYFYMILLKDINDKMIMKYGLTKHNSISKRWSPSLNYNLFIFKRMDSKIAIKIENEFHKIFRHTYTPDVIKTTECFEYCDSNIDKALNILNGYGCCEFLKEEF